MNFNARFSLSFFRETSEQGRKSLAPLFARPLVGGKTAVKYYSSVFVSSITPTHSSSAFTTFGHFMDNLPPPHSASIIFLSLLIQCILRRRSIDPSIRPSSLFVCGNQCKNEMRVGIVSNNIHYMIVLSSPSVDRETTVKYFLPV